jgi:hypothetical protein
VIQSGGMKNGVLILIFLSCIAFVMIYNSIELYKTIDKSKPSIINIVLDGDAAYHKIPQPNPTEVNTIDRSISTTKNNDLLEDGLKRPE